MQPLKPDKKKIHFVIRYEVPYLNNGIQYNIFILPSPRISFTLVFLSNSMMKEHCLGKA